ncbi:MAG TPA: peptide deformylase [Candidatus Wallbacteria bacterium]|nr:peptide deformylase [Candidatus Wallbacteria bacterium]
MTILPIYVCTDKVLRQKAADCAKPYSQYKALAENMIQTMYKAPGVGLAAPQIGVSLKLVVYDAGNGPVVLINPEILSCSEQMSAYEEGCLSVPDITAEIIRPASVKFKAFDLDGYKYEKEVTGMEARVVQHELDHLSGVLFIDRLQPKDKPAVEKLLKKAGMKVAVQKAR